MMNHPTIAETASEIAIRVFEFHGCDGQSNKMLRALRKAFADELPGLPVHLASSGWLPAEAMTRLRTFEQWGEHVGDVLWFRLPTSEPPYVGSPLDYGMMVEAHGPRGLIARGNVGGWPYDEADEPFLRWTPIPFPELYLKDDDAKGPAQ